MKQSGEDGWWRFLELCTQLKTANEFNEFFQLFLTLEEREDMAGRYLIVKELLKGEKTQREMAKELHVSISKITRGSNSLKRRSNALKQKLIKKMK